MIGYHSVCFHAVFVLFWACSFLPSTAQQPVIGTVVDSAKKLPPAQWQRPRTLDVKHIALNLCFDWQKKQAFGTATLMLSPMSASRAIGFDAQQLTISSITLTSGKTLAFEHKITDTVASANNLTITLDRSYQAEEEITLMMQYRTSKHRCYRPQ